MRIDSPIYRKAFQNYLRTGKSMERCLKMEMKCADYYVWVTAGDDKVRPSHADNEGQVFSMQNPPETGNPGDEPGCRCAAEPLSVDKQKALGDSKGHTAIYNPNGSSELRSEGTRSWRNNNPGNIRGGAFSQRHGAIGNAGGFAVFPDDLTGHRASVALLLTPTYATLTIDKAIARHSPSNENDTANLQELIHEIGGFSGHEVIGELSPQQLDRLAAAIQRTEGWKPGTVTNRPAPRCEPQKSGF